MSARERYLQIQGNRIFIIEENDGWRFIHRGAEATTTEVTLEHLRLNGPAHFYEQAKKHFEKVCPSISAGIEQGENEHGIE